MHEGLFHLLFAQLAQITLEKSIPPDSDLQEPDQELAFYRIERIGFQVGQRLIERLVLGHRTFSDQLEAFKFICKDYWNVLFRKSIDNLKTNHKVSIECIENILLHHLGSLCPARCLISLDCKVCTRHFHAGHC